MSLVQNVNSPSLYVDGCRLTWVSTTSITVSAGLLRSVDNALDINLGNFLGENPNQTANQVTTINAAVNGANGLDTGSIAASKLYYVYVISDPTLFNQPATILSLNSSVTGPYMPTGYGSYRRIGQVSTNGSSQIYNFIQSGSFTGRRYQFIQSIALLTAGASTAIAAIALTNLLPATINLPVSLNASLTAGVAGGNAAIYSSAATGTPVASTTLSASVAALAQLFPSFTVMDVIASSVPTLAYTVNAGTTALTLTLAGYEDYI